MDDRDAELLGLVVELPMELASRPGGEAAAQASAAARDPHPGELLEDERGAPSLGLLQEPVRDRVEPLADPVAFPSAFPTTEPPTDPTVVRLLPTEATTSREVGLLDARDLLEGDREAGEGLLLEEDPVEGALVRIEGEDGGGGVGGRRLALDDQDRAGGGENELLDRRRRQDAAVIVGESRSRPAHSPKRRERRR